MALRPTLTTTTDPALLAAVQAIQTTEQRTRASVVQELLTLGLKARSKRKGLTAVERVHARYPRRGGLMSPIRLSAVTAPAGVETELAD